LDQFVKEHEKDSDGGEARLNTTLKSALDPVPQKKKPAQKKKYVRRKCPLESDVVKVYLKDRN